MNQGIHYHRFCPRTPKIAKPLCDLRLHISREHPFHLCSNSLLVLYSPLPSPQQVLRHGLPHELTWLAACSTFSRQVYAKQLWDSHRNYGNLGPSCSYYFPNVKMTRDFQQWTVDGFAPLLFPVECSVIIMSSLECSMERLGVANTNLPQLVWAKLSTPLQVALQENPSIRKVVFGSLGGGTSTDSHVAVALQRIRSEYAHVFDSIHVCVERMATEIACRTKLLTSTGSDPEIGWDGSIGSSNRAMQEETWP